MSIERPTETSRSELFLGIRKSKGGKLIRNVKLRGKVSGRWR